MLENISNQGVEKRNMMILSDNDLIRRWRAPAMGAVSPSKSSLAVAFSLKLSHHREVLLPPHTQSHKRDKSRDQYIEQFDFPYCEEVSKYEKQAKIGQVSLTWRGKEL